MRTFEPNKRAERVLKVLFLAIALALILWCCLGCTYIPKELEDSIHLLHAGNVIICDDYIKKLIEQQPEDPEKTDKLKLVQKHLQLSQELDKYVKGKGGKLILKGEYNGVE